MQTEELIKYLKQNEDKVFILELKGIISTIVKISSVKIEIDDLYLTIKNNTNVEEKIILNLHQLMKFNIIEEDKILLNFDQLQNIFIQIKNNYKKA